MAQSDPGVAHKDKGNSAFKAGDYPVAVGHYTAAILADPTNPTFLLNRAAAYLRLGKNEDAERDSSAALNLDPKSSKAWFRRARARISLGNLVEAQGDLHSLLRIEPSNSEAQQELRKVQEVLRKSQPRRSPATPIIVPPNTISPLLPTSPKRRRVPITVIDHENPPTALSAIKFAQAGLVVHGSPPTHAHEQLHSPAPESSSKQYKPLLPPPTSQPRGGIFRSSGNHTVFESQATRVTQPPSSTTSPAPPAGLTSSPTASHVAKPGTNPFAAPDPLTLTLSTFQKAWESLTTTRQQWEYLQQIPAVKLPLIFRESLEPAIVVSLLRTFLDILKDPTTVNKPRRGVSEYMATLPRSSRWRTVLLLLSDDERGLAEEVWTLLAGCGVDQKVQEAWGIPPCQ